MAKELTESRRTRYTRRAMQDALIELLRNQPLGSITVKALCERADVNRSTFYAHYASIEELLHDIEDETMAWVTTALEQLLAQPDSAGIEHVIERICQYIADNRNHLQVLMSPKADIGFQQQLLGLIYSQRGVGEQLQSSAGYPARRRCVCDSPCPAALGFCNTGSPPISRPLPNRCPTPSSPCVRLPRSEHSEFSELSEACGFISIARYSFACSPAAPTPALAIAHK